MGDCSDELDSKQRNVRVHFYSLVKAYLIYYELHSISNFGQVDATSYVQLQPNVEGDETPAQGIQDLGSK